MHAFTCSSCGAEIVCDENTMATECCYCGNPTMLPSRFSGMLKPDYVIPFKKTKEEAVAALEEFYKGKKLLPDKFTANNRVQAIQGMYVPFWLFNSDISASGVYKGENDSVVTTPDEIITTTSVYRCERNGSMRFERIPVDGSKKMDDSYMESIEPFDYSDLVPFSSAYLSGFLADKYDVDAEASITRANERIKRSTEDAFASTVQGYTSVVPVSSTINLQNGRAKYALYPVWILNTQWNGQKFTFGINGQTGKIAGDLPMDKGKFWTWLLGIAGAATAVSFALSYLFWLL
jgi:DNA-directed RNA polymerase subunit RPC12/RpoP